MLHSIDQLRQKDCVNAELVGKLQKEGNFILYGKKQLLKYVPGYRYSGNVKAIESRLKI